MKTKKSYARLLGFMSSFPSLIYLLRNKFVARVPCGRVHLTMLEDVRDL